ncbi:MAG: Re/Si-specific NAD(P)(+) transhydrogenase subunit alpha [Bacteroidia bacterium]|nr:Re/Si-specific NAD(P)(+) transhydrogenase subunit alpha [Bacteroidia bacterium]MBP9690161.1 Re/Si-specific NAD(P)(+) transhydrogenase subunit alpha [Bacteroidia bacterium]
MKILVVKERKANEKRVALTPAVASQFIKQGYSCLVESNAGYSSNFDDNAYIQAGCTIVNKGDGLAQADVVICVNAPNNDELNDFKNGSILISYIYHLFNADLIKQLAAKQITVFSMDAMPRISRAQSMDALSSQNNLAGYKAVILGADVMGKIFPLMMTAAGTITPSRVLIFGAGVAGLQAVATAKRLGAIVEVTDVRPETKEQVESLGGKFIEVKSEGVKVEGGYAKEVSADYLEKQKEAVNKSLASADLVITTALVAGKKAPTLITEDQVKLMKLGSVIVDMAVEQGGNCAISELDKTVVKHGVSIVGIGNLPSTLAQNASELYAKNIYNFLTHLSTKDGMKWELEEEITKGTLITHQGIIVHPSLQTATA